MYQSKSVFVQFYRKYHIEHKNYCSDKSIQNLLKRYIKYIFFKYNMSVIKFVVLLQGGCLIRSRNYLPFTILYVHYLSFMRRVLVIKTSASRRAETAHRSGEPEFTRCLWSFCCVICGFCVVFCRLMFVRLSFFIWPLYCLSFFDLPLLIITRYLPFLLTGIHSGSTLTYGKML